MTARVACPTHQLPMDVPYLLDGYMNGWMCPTCREAFLDRRLAGIWERMAQREEIAR
jgi:hypothetical protein